MNPLGYARSLARAVLQEGGIIHAGSKVTHVERENYRWLVKTAGGTVTADKVNFSTGAYTTDGWPRLERTFNIIRVFVAVTHPLSERHTNPLFRRTPRCMTGAAISMSINTMLMAASSPRCSR